MNFKIRSNFTILIKIKNKIMIKVVLSVTTLLVAMILSAQTTGKGLQIDIRGRDCAGGGGLCSVNSI